MKNKYSGHCFRCEKYVRKQAGRILFEGIPKLLCLRCAEQIDLRVKAKLIQLKEEQAYVKKEYARIQKMWWNK